MGTKLFKKRNRSSRDSGAARQFAFFAKPSFLRKKNPSETSSTGVLPSFFQKRRSSTPNEADATLPFSLPSFLSCERKRTKKRPPTCANMLVVRKIPGIVLLSHSQIYSTIAAGALNYRVREGNECFCSAMDTGKYKTKK